MSGSLVADLGIGADVWLLLTFLCCVTLFFKFGRIWSIRNLDLLLLFALTPGMMLLVGSGPAGSWWGYLALFVGSFLWICRCLLDLGLARRPHLEPNLNTAGLACITIGVIGLFAIEMIHLPVQAAVNRNPADSLTKQQWDSPAEEPELARESSDHSESPVQLPANKREVLCQRVLAMSAHIGLVVALVTVGWRHYERPIAGFAAATCYLILPYARFALVDCGQLVPSALIITALVCYLRPLIAGLMIGFAAGWMPACLGLLPLWAGFYLRRGFWKFILASGTLVVFCLFMKRSSPTFAHYARVLGSKSLHDSGIWAGVEAPLDHSFWSAIDASYRLPVQVAYAIAVLVATLLPPQKNLGELIALSAALLAASQFWYLDSGGAHVLLYLPLVILMMFRPTSIYRTGFGRPVKLPT